MYVRYPLDTPRVLVLIFFSLLLNAIKILNTNTKPLILPQNRRLTATFRADTTAKRAELAELSAKAVTFTATRCASCGAGLDLPTVHFMCKHSFHQRCLDTASVNVSNGTRNATTTTITKLKSSNRNNKNNNSNSNNQI